MGAGSRAASALPAVLAAVIYLAIATPAIAVPRTDAHEALLSSRFGCPACHGIGSGIFDEDPAGPFGPVTADPCVACHTGGGDAPQVFGGDADNYRSATRVGHGIPSGLTCLDCHSAHGPWLADADGPAVKLLKKLRYQKEALAANDPRRSGHDVAIAVWCTGCHEQWPAMVAGRRTGGAVFRTSRGVSFDAHPISEADGVRAFRDADSCRACHAAGSPGGIGAGDFPHFTPDADAMLVGCDPAAGTTCAPVADRSLDGVCLRCHRDRTIRGLVGVGITY